MVEGKRFVYLGEGRSEAPSFVEFDPLPTLQETKKVIDFSRTVMRSCIPCREDILIINNKIARCLVYKIETAEGGVTYAISDSVLARVDNDGKLLGYTPFTYFVRR